MRMDYLSGMVVAVLLSVALGLFGEVDVYGVIALTLLLWGVWTLVSAFAIFETSERTYYSSWGVVLAVLSTFDFVKNLSYTIALVLMAVVVLILDNVYLGRAPKLYNAATTPPAAGGGSPAATDA